MDLILSILVDIGIIREEYLHDKRIRKKEQQDGVPRTLERYLFRPSLLIFLGTLLFISILTSVFMIIQHTYINPGKTEQEILKIGGALEKWKNHTGQYPESLKELIGNGPIRQGWEVDAWNHPYQYTLSDDRANFKLVSSGSDGFFGTKDDLSN
ncbi:type II secretion system protein GspG [Robertkochia solimangrovi]|uniref:type II secretion system protein GspG n=1 Tax=Robertkochia solimangrovi TaxID=2213046 RepID=UPI0011811DA0|nr:type II secretion system protein GspG [Robertkochia solimangrovi]TRZ41618.1 hypothetical protein DMZ48_16550 [Robertkochia solimangrovi]